MASETAETISQGSKLILSAPHHATANTANLNRFSELIPKDTYRHEHIHIFYHKTYTENSPFSLRTNRSSMGVLELIYKVR